MLEKEKRITESKTWLMTLNLSSDERIYNNILEIIRCFDGLSDEEIGEKIRNYFKNRFYAGRKVYRIFDVLWSDNDLCLVDWEKVVKFMKGE